VFVSEIPNRMYPLTDSTLARDGKVLLLAMDHGLEHGPVDFEPVPETVDPAAVFDIATHDAVTGFAVQKGVAETYYPSYEDDVSLLAKLNGNSNLWQGEPFSPQTWTVENAAEMGADAVGYTVYAGSNREAEMFEDFRDAQENAREEDLPMVMWSYPRGEGVEDDTADDVIAYATRIGLELGADVTKVKYPGSVEAMEWAVDAAGESKVIMSGGSKTDELEFLRNVNEFLDAGGSGLAVGRNVWQHENPEAMLDALEAVIFEDADPEEALTSVTA
jgi:class I fructose-bisphosphate aldolase